MKKCVITQENLKLKSLMKEQKITYKQMSERLGVGISTLCNKLNGKGNFTTLEISRMVVVLEINASQIGEYFFQGVLQNDRNSY